MGKPYLGRRPRPRTWPHGSAQAARGSGHSRGCNKKKPTPPHATPVSPAQPSLKKIPTFAADARVAAPGWIARRPQRTGGHLRTCAPGAPRARTKERPRRGHAAPHPSPSRPDAALRRDSASRAAPARMRSGRGPRPCRGEFAAARREADASQPPGEPRAPAESGQAAQSPASAAAPATADSVRPEKRTKGGGGGGQGPPSRGAPLCGRGGGTDPRADSAQRLGTAWRKQSLSGGEDE